MIRIPLDSRAALVIWEGATSGSVAQAIIIGCLMQLCEESETFTLLKTARREREVQFR